MIKKIIVLIVVCILLFPVSAMANDAGADLDKDNYLAIKATPLQDSIEIGEYFTFKLELTNNSKDTIRLNSLDRVFDGNLLLQYFGKDISTEAANEIEAGKKLTLTLKITVPYDLNWYKKADKFYVDFDIKINYNVTEYINSGNNEDDVYYGHENKPLEAIPLEITNLLSGDELVEISLKQTEALELIEDYDIWSDYYGRVTHKISIKNISGSAIDNMFILDDNSANDDLAKIQSDITYSDARMLSEYYLNYGEIPNVLIAEYKLIFQSEGQYYASGIKEEYPPVIISRPKVEFSVIEQEVDGQNIERLQIENTSDICYKDFVLFIKDTRRVYDEDILDNPPVLLNPNDLHIANLKNPNSHDSYIFFGYTDGNKLYLWKLSSNKEFDSFDYFYYKTIDVSHIALQSTSNDASTPAVSATPLPTEKPTPSPTAQATPVPTDSPTVSPAIEITDVKKSSSIPIWVWIILPASVFGAGLIIFLIKKKSKSKDE